MRVYIIAGASGSRKSSTIRALTGAGQRGVKEVRTDAEEDVRIYVQIQSPQEEHISANEFIQRVEQAQPHADHVLVALRAGTAMDYIHAFIANGWDIVDVFVLGQAWPQGDGWDQLLAHLPQPHDEQNARGLPANEIAHTLRDKWGWL